MSSVLGLEPGGGWQTISTRGLREFLEVAGDEAVVFELPESIVLFVDVDGFGRRGATADAPPVGPVIALGRRQGILGPLTAQQEAWIRGWTETMRPSTRREILEAVLG